jgi:hypothetical protein
MAAIFNKGDRVRVARTFTIVALRGRKGTVNDVDGSEYEVDVDGYCLPYRVRADELVPVTPDEEKREKAIRLAEEQAFDEGKKCEHCDGTGKVPGGQRLVHSVSPAGFGADWNVEAVVDAIRTSPAVLWGEPCLYSDHQLHINVDGKFYIFQVKRPVCPACERSGGTPGCIECDPALVEKPIEATS